MVLAMLSLGDRVEIYQPAAFAVVTDIHGLMAAGLRQEQRRLLKTDA